MTAGCPDVLIKDQFSMFAGGIEGGDCGWRPQAGSGLLLCKKEDGVLIDEPQLEHYSIIMP